MNDSIKLINIRLYGYHGVNPFEREKGQFFLLNLRIYSDLIKAGLSDSIDDTIDYSELYESIKNIVEGPSVKLLERLATMVADEVFKTFPSVKKLILEVIKPDPPIKDSCIQGVSVKIIRYKE
jgi:dihydroneopterin aldolase